MTTSAGTTSLSYDYEDRVTSIAYPGGGSNSFTYNGLDTRVGKVDSSGTSTYRRDGADVTDPVLSDGSATYTPGVSRHSASGTRFYGADYLGTNRVETDSTQTLQATRTYDAFGMLVSTTGTPQGPFGFAGEAGYQEDGDSGLKLLGHRYYDASTGRFLTRDPSQDGENWYVYSDGNPLVRIDDEGLEWIYHQRSGKLEHVDKDGNKTSYGSGFSGAKGKWRNNPVMQPVKDKGPIPTGGYTIEHPRNHFNNGRPVPYNMPLDPDPGTNTYGRGGFKIHGGDPKKDPSEGCIIFPLSVRHKIWNSKDHHLTVVRE